MDRDKYVQQFLKQMRVRMEVRGLRPVTMAVYARVLARFIAQLGKPLDAVEPHRTSSATCTRWRYGDAPRRAATSS